MKIENWNDYLKEEFKNNIKKLDFSNKTYKFHKNFIDSVLN